MSLFRSSSRERWFFTPPGKNGIEMVVLGVRQYLACYDFILLFNVSYWGVYDHFYGCLVYDFKCQSIIGHTSTVIICVCFATYFYTLYISLLLVQAILSRLWTCMPPASREFLPSTSNFVALSLPPLLGRSLPSVSHGFPQNCLKSWAFAFLFSSLDPLARTQP